MKTLLIVTSMLFLCAVGAQAKLGAGADELDRLYGKPTKAHSSLRQYTVDGQTLSCTIRGGKCVQMSYNLPKEPVRGGVQTLLFKLDPGQFWREHSELASCRGNENFERRDKTASAKLEERSGKWMLHIFSK